ncbi:MAG: hypothetical protein AAGJ18_03870 [Bacteroidota bacterium]
MGNFGMERNAAHYITGYYATRRVTLQKWCATRRVTLRGNDAQLGELRYGRVVRNSELCVTREWRIIPNSPTPT